MYPEATNLSPQGTDVGKALLRYAEKKELKAHGLIQLKIWAANCSGNDKISFDDRVAWWDATWGNKPDLEENLSWLSYDSPMLFRQVALEIRDAYASGNPNTYLTSISVCKDGSQNGLQHLSAIGRDEVGGEAVNLINSPVPADLYADVGELVLASVTGDYEQIMLGDKRTDDFGQPLPPIVWFQRLSTPKIRRSTVKRSVLAYPYGVTKAGMSNGLIEDGLCNGLPGAQNANSWYLAGKIDGSVREVVISAARIMDWFRELAEKAGKKGLSIDWVTPSGFPCRQAYSQKEYKRYELYNMTLAVPQPIPNTIDVKRQVQGIVANIIHSFDCVHAVLTCNAAMANNITSLQFIHDSFGTHACDIDELGVILRNEFISMHSNDLMQQFVDFAKANDLDMPPFPSQGRLDLESVRNSAYFFS
jgi:DNA-directed RNA polymerase